MQYIIIGIRVYRTKEATAAVDKATEATEATEAIVEAAKEVIAVTVDPAFFWQARGVLHRQVKQRDATTRRLYGEDHRSCKGGHSCNCRFDNDSGKGRIKSSMACSQQFWQDQWRAYVVWQKLAKLPRLLRRCSQGMQRLLA